MRSHKDLKNQRFGKLVALRPIKIPSRGVLSWVCRCDCGNEKIARGDCLRKGLTKSCGCNYALRGNGSPLWEGCGNIGKSTLTKIQHDARIRKLNFSLTLDYLWELYKGQDGRCALTGEKIYFGKTWRDRSKTASLDRIDPSKGYILGNVQWVHKDVNFAKQSMSQSEFISLCQKVVDHCLKEKRVICNADVDWNKQNNKELLS